LKQAEVIARLRGTTIESMLGPKRAALQAETLGVQTRAEHHEAAAQADASAPASLADVEPEAQGAGSHKGTE
jgi:hypothetical protein